MNVFISGSREINKSKVQPVIEKVIARLKEKGHTILVGDCDGVDFMVQQEVRRQDVPMVVYHVGNRPRNLVSPDTMQCKVTRTSEGYGAKDRVMARDCDMAIMFWNDWSPGTNKNVMSVGNLAKLAFVWSEKHGWLNHHDHKTEATMNMVN